MFYFYLPHQEALIFGQYAWLQGGMCGCRGDMGGCGGACMVGACMGYDEIRSMSGRYAYYWNAFLFTVKLSNLQWRSKKMKQISRNITM